MLQHVEEMYATSWVQGSDGAVYLPALEPGPTGAGPGSTRHEGGDVLEVVVDRSLRRGHCLDAFDLAFADHSCYVFGNVLRQSEHTTVADGGIRSKKGW